MSFRFVNPFFLLLLAVIPLLIWRYYKMRQRLDGSIRFSAASLLKSINPSFLAKYSYIPFLMRMVTLVLLIIAFARPQAGMREEDILTEGIEIFIVLDNSGSMRAEDFKPENRLGAAREKVRKFIEGRKNDRIGLVIFAAKSYTRCPLTLDYIVLKDFLSKVDFTPREDDGTAIGMGIATAVKRLKESRAKSKVIILLTDGRNNRGQITPQTAAELARNSKIRIYTIGVGTKGEAPYPVDDPILGRRYVMLPEEIQENVLMEIADKTGGMYFRATDRDALGEIFSRIDSMEKTRIEMKAHVSYRELFSHLFLPACLLFLSEMVLVAWKFSGAP
ncbi:MAG: VWA domain-containing protein [Acidobacteriota bacterium]